MSKNAMAGAITLCGVGLCTIGGGLMMQSGSAAHAAGVMPAVAVAAALHAQAGPTIVWMGVHSSGGGLIIYSRMWSDGRMETRQVARYYVFDSQQHSCQLIRWLGRSPTSTRRQRLRMPQRHKRRSCCRWRRSRLCPQLMGAARWVRTRRDVPVPQSRRSDDCRGDEVTDALSPRFRYPRSKAKRMVCLCLYVGVPLVALASVGFWH